MPKHANILLTLILTTLAFVMVGCDALEGETILAWNDPDSATTVEVRSQMHGGKTRVHMEVTRSGKTKRQVLAEGVQLRNASLVRFNEWLLVMAGKYVIGGYQIENEKIYPMNADALPFTVRDVSGYVVDQKQLGEGDDVPPINFKERTDPRN